MYTLAALYLHLIKYKYISTKYFPPNIFHQNFATIFFYKKMSTIFFLYHISLKTNSYSFLSSYTFFLGYLRCIFFLFLLRCIPPAPLLYSANPENLAQEPSPLFLPSVRQSTNFAGQIFICKTTQNFMVKH